VKQFIALTEDEGLLLRNHERIQVSASSELFWLVREGDSVSLLREEEHGHSTPSELVVKWVEATAPGNTAEPPR